jgi:hypothetical protein
MAAGIFVLALLAGVLAYGYWRTSVERPVWKRLRAAGIEIGVRASMFEERQPGSTIYRIRKPGRQINYKTVDAPPPRYGLLGAALKAIGIPPPDSAIRLVIANRLTSDDDLVGLNKLTDLEVINLAVCPITDASLVHLRGLKRVDRLDLNNTAVSDDGLAHIAGLTAMERLDLRATKITDEGINHLLGMVNLRDLELQGSAVTQVGLDRIARSLPQCGVLLR